MEQHLNSPSLEDHRWPDRQGDASMGLTQPLSPALTQSPNSPSQLSEPGSARIPQRTSSMQPESACSDVSRGEGRSESRSSRRSQRPTTPRDREPPLPQRGSTVDGAEGIGSAMMATPASSAPTSPDANRVGMSSPPSMSSIIASSHASAGTSSSTNSRPRSASAVSMSTFPTKGESSSPPPIPIPAFRRASSPQRNDKGEGDATGFGGASQPAESASARRPLGGNAEGLVDGRAQGADGLRGWSRSRLNESTLAEELERGRATSATPTRATMGSGFGETSMPEISIHPESPMDGRPVLQDSQDAQEVLRDEDEPRKRSTHDRSDSDGSFASTTSFGRNLTAGSFHGGRAIETEGGHDFDSRLSSRNRAFGLDEELKTPATPYFDIDPTLIPEDDAQDDGSARRNSNRSSASRGSEPGRGRTGSTGTIPSARLIDPSVRQSVVSPTERTRASSLKMSASPGVAGLSALTRNSEASRTSLKTKRPSSADSPSPKFEAPADADADQTDSQSRIQAKQDLGVRPSTSGSSSLSTRGLLDNGKLLVSPSTSSGTISQRRKNSQAGVLELNRPIPSGTQSTTAWSENFSTPALKTPLSGPLVQTAPAAVSAAPGIPQSAAPSRFGDNQNAVSSSSPTDAFADGEKVNTLRQSGVPASKETAVPSSFRASLSSSFGRQRALSQPGKRPSIPPSFLASNAGTDTAPPVPRMMRKASMPSTPGGGPPPGLRALASTNAAQAVSNGQPAQQQQQGQPSRPPSEAAHHPTPFRFPSPAPTTSSGYLVTEGGLSSPAPSAMSDYFSTEKPIAIPDIFPTGLPSSASGAPSFMSSSSSGAFPWLGLASSLPDPASVAPVPSYPSLRPFHLMRQLHMSITKGGYVTRRLYVPRNLWIQQGARLMAIESKVRMLELVASGIEGVEKSGESLLLPHNATSRDGEVMANAAKFVKQLEEFDILLVEVQNTLAKKLGFLESVTGKKANVSAARRLGIM